MIPVKLYTEVDKSLFCIANIFCGPDRWFYIKMNYPFNVGNYTNISVQSSIFSR